MSNADGAASANPGAVEAELASDSVTLKRVPHLGHFIRLPGLTLGGRFKMTPHRWHWIVWGIAGFSPGPGGPRFSFPAKKRPLDRRPRARAYRSLQS